MMRRALPVVVLAATVSMSASAESQTTAAPAEVATIAGYVELTGPAGSESFGDSAILVLSNGNYVIADRSFDVDGAEDVGAVFLYDGLTNAIISILTGTSPGDSVGSRLFEVGDSDFVIASPKWDHGPIADVGAVTWADGTTGISGTVTTANSLHGTTTLDGVGNSDITVLSNGNYVIDTPSWDHGPIANAGAVVWADGTTGVTGPITAANSLHGTNSITSHTSFETSWRTTPLSNGNYVVAIPGWNNGPIANAGAVVWADGTTGITGPVTTTNSLHGTSAGDSVGGRRELWDPGTVTPLSNGNYIVGSPSWNNGSVVDAGAATLADGATGTTGPVTTTNSLHGTTAGDQVGTEVTPLANGNYVVQTPGWDHGPIVDAGAATWADGTTGITGPVTTTNSLHGTTTEAHVGYAAIGLVNGNYIIWSPFWDHGSIPDAGAVTWADGTTGITGPVTTANSLHGTSTEKRVGRSFRRLDNGGYVVTSPTWGDDNEGAITYGSPHRGVVGPVTPSNSLIDYRAGAKPSSTSPKIRLTSGNAVLVGTGADRAWLLLLDPRPDGVTTVAPARLLETRDHPDYTTTDNRFRATGPLTAGTEIALDVAGRGGIPTNATAAFLNITAILPDAPGHLTIYPCGTRRPTTSTLNYQPGDVIANNVLAPIGTNGRVCIHTHATTHIITDTTGYDPG